MPARAPRTPGRRPGGLVGGRRLPEHEVERVALAGHLRQVAALVGDRQHRVARQAGELPVGRPGSDAEVDVACHCVGQLALQEPGDQVLHLGDVLGRTRIVIGRQPVQGRHLGQEGGHVPVAEGEVILAELARTAQEVVVDIGQVLDVDDVMAQVLEVPMQDVEADVGEGMTQVSGVVRGHAADVEPDRLTVEGCEGHADAAANVKQGEGHAPDSRGGRRAASGSTGASRIRGRGRSAADQVAEGARHHVGGPALVRGLRPCTPAHRRGTFLVDGPSASDSELLTG